MHNETLQILNGFKELLQSDFKVTKEDERFLYFSGWASVYGVIDKQDEIVEPGAYTDFLKGLKSPNDLPVYYRHLYKVGYYTKIEDRNYGLWVEGVVDKSTKEGRFVADIIATEGIKGLSIRYYQGLGFRDGGLVHLTNLRLAEISLTPSPANELALVDSWKEDKDRYVHFKDFLIDQLRGYGLSQREAKILFMEGAKSLTSHLLLDGFFDHYQSDRRGS